MKSKNLKNMKRSSISSKSN